MREALRRDLARRRAPRPAAGARARASGPERLLYGAPGGLTASMQRARSSGGIVMPQKAWSRKRERQYEHIKEGLLERGEDQDEAKEIAARVVNKERARAG